MGGAGAQDAKRVAGQAVVEVADYSWDQTDQDLTVYVNTDWAGRHNARTSTPGGAIVRG